jgi:GTP-binding nuclear protein Ran
MNFYKIVVIGSAGCGKTSFVNSLQGEAFDKRYIPTLGVDVSPLHFKENAYFNIWDTAGDEKFRGLGDGYYIQSHACIVMFDASDPLSLLRGANLIQGYRNVCPEAPVLFVRNKSDLEEFETTQTLDVLSCSSKTGKGCKEVMEAILEKIIQANKKEIHAKL